MVVGLMVLHPRRLRQGPFHLSPSWHVLANKGARLTNDERSNSHKTGLTSTRQGSARQRALDQCSYIKRSVAAAMCMGRIACAVPCCAVLMATHVSRRTNMLILHGRRCHVHTCTGRGFSTAVRGARCTAMQGERRSMYGLDV